MVGLTSIPGEVVDVLCVFLKTRDIHSLRLVCKYLAGACTHQIGKRGIGIFLDGNVAARLESSTPCQSVTRAAIATRYNPSWLTPQSWKDCILLQKEYQPDRHIPDTDWRYVRDITWRGEHGNVYLEDAEDDLLEMIHRRQCERFGARDAGEILLDMAAILKSCPNLKTLEIAAHQFRSRYLSLYHIDDNENNRLSQPLCLGHAELTLFATVEAIARHEENGLTHGITELIFKQEGCFENRVRVKWSDLKRALPSIQKLTFCYSEHYVEHSSSFDFLFQMLPNVEVAFLMAPSIFQQRYNQNAAPHEFGTYIKTTTWPRLTSVTLSGFYVEDNDLFLSFLNRHKATLKRLHLGDVVTVYGEYSQDYYRYTSLANILAYIGQRIRKHEWVLRYLTVIGGQGAWTELFQFDPLGYNSFGFYRTCDYRQSLTLLSEWMMQQSEDVKKVVSNENDRWLRFLKTRTHNFTRAPSQYSSLQMPLLAIIDGFEPVEIRFGCSGGEYTLEEFQHDVSYRPDARHTYKYGTWDLTKNYPTTVLTTSQDDLKLCSERRITKELRRIEFPDDD